MTILICSMNDNDKKINIICYSAYVVQELVRTCKTWKQKMQRKTNNKCKYKKSGILINE